MFFNIGLLSDEADQNPFRSTAAWALTFNRLSADFCEELHGLNFLGLSFLEQQYGVGRRCRAQHGVA